MIYIDAKLWDKCEFSPHQEEMMNAAGLYRRKESSKEQLTFFDRLENKILENERGKEERNKRDA